MNILAFFTNNSSPKTGLTPKVKIREVSTGAIIVNWSDMDEIGDGWYKYDFPYDYTKEYVAVCDAGAGQVTDSERFMFGAKDNNLHDNSKIVWDAQTTSHQTSGSFGESLGNISNDLKRALGLMHENIFIDNPIYDEFNNLVSARVRIYSVNTSVGSNNDVIGTYLITSDGIGAGKFSNWRQISI